MHLRRGLQQLLDGSSILPCAKRNIQARAAERQRLLRAVERGHDGLLHPKLSEHESYSVQAREFHQFQAYGERVSGCSYRKQILR